MNLDLQEFLAFDHAQMIAPIRLSFRMRSRGNVDLFLLEVIGDKDSPIRFDGRMVAFDDENLCRSAAERLKLALPGVGIEDSSDFICDIHGAIKLVTEGECDDNAVVLNCINTLLDLVATGPFDLPDEYKILRAVADRLTFREEFGEFKQTRTLIRNALLWCAGIASVDSMLVRSLSEFEFLLPGLSARVPATSLGGDSKI
jgi:hypothetical protein